MYWVIDTKDLEEQFGSESFHIVKNQSASGDVCHMVISGITDDQGKQFTKMKCVPPNVFLCANSGCTQLMPENIENLAELLR